MRRRSKTQNIPFYTTIVSTLDKLFYKIPLTLKINSPSGSLIRQGDRKPQLDSCECLSKFIIQNYFSVVITICIYIFYRFVDMFIQSYCIKQDYVLLNRH